MKRRPSDTTIPKSAKNDEPAFRGLDRRQFLIGSSAVVATSVALAALPLKLRAAIVSETSVTTFAPRQKNLLAALHEHLFPPDSNSPGAADINSVAYLENALREPRLDADVRNFVINGLRWLGEAAEDMHDLPFIALDDAQKETFLRYLADKTRWGKNWLSTQLRFILEALLADPIYGGNPGGIGWQWLEHQPGFPRPPANKVFGKL
jgi:gluconate 2-dehydrogenase gamma chain